MSTIMDITKTEPVYKTAKCKHCGSKTVAWQTSKKTGRYYLTEVFMIDGEDRTDYRDFHSAYCELPERHDEKQAQIDAEEASERAEEKAKRAEHDSNLRRSQATASDQVLAWYSMSLDEAGRRLPKLAEEITELEARIEREKRDPVSMDYLVEYIRYVEMLKGLDAQKRFLCAERDVLIARLDNEG